MTTPPKPWRSGFCGLNDPESCRRCARHPRADGVPCSHHCHNAPEPATPDAAEGPQALMPLGLHADVPEADYHADHGSLSVSGAKLILQAPALFRHRLDHPIHSDVFDYGSAAHRKVLGVGVDIVVHDFDPDKVKSPKATKAWKDQQAEVRAAGAVLLLPEEHRRVCAMADRLADHPTALRLLSQGRPELSAYARDDETGIIRRGRFDWLSDRVLTDYKSAADASPQAFAKAVARYGYDQQADWYLWLAEQVGEQRDAFAFVVQEKEPPYLVEVYELDAAFLQRGRERNRRALERFRDCTESGVWPGYTGRDFTTLSPPKWALFEEEYAA